MSILEDYEKRFGLSEFTPNQVLEGAEDAEAELKNTTGPAYPQTRARLVVWLHDRLQIAYAAFEAAKDGPKLHRCGWCWRVAGATREAWEALPLMDLDAVQNHAQVCEHNPLVQIVDRQRQELHALQAANADIQGRVFDVDLRDAIHTLLKGEMTAGELRRALGELVR